MESREFRDEGSSNQRRRYGTERREDLSQGSEYRDNDQNRGRWRDRDYDQDRWNPNRNRERDYGRNQRSDEDRDSYRSDYNRNDDYSSGPFDGRQSSGSFSREYGRERSGESEYERPIGGPNSSYGYGPRGSYGGGSYGGRDSSRDERRDRRFNQEGPYYRSFGNDDTERRQQSVAGRWSTNQLDNSSWGKGLAEAGRHGGKGPKGYQRSDERIREDVCETLSENSDVDASEIDVSVNNGEVTLSGNVEDRNVKRTAVDIIENLRGVKDVHNELRVHASKSSSSAHQVSSRESKGTESKTEKHREHKAAS
ncbi:MAG: BON domain-containing protein [Oligoflexales bacterium]